MSQGENNIQDDLTQGDKVGGDKISIGDVGGSVVAVGAGATAVYQQGLTVEEVAALVVELKNKDQPEVWNGRIPYLGLTSFQESDAQFFFGRESLVDDLLERVQTAHFIVIAGPSGSGKSSVARAGLFHALREGRLEKSDRWLLATMQPKGNPIGQLAQALERATKSTQVGDAIRAEGASNPSALQRQIEIYLTEDPAQRFVLLVDQFEETFTQTKDEPDRAAFIDLLTTAAVAEDGRTIVLLSLRSDFISHCARYPDLRALMSQQFQLVGAMDPPDLAKAITLPALEVGAKIDSELVSRIMADMKGEPGALPLMSFALRDLFEAEKTAKGEPMALTLAGYLKRGGIESALDRHANKVFDGFSDEQKVLARGVFSKLIEVGQGRADTRRTVAFKELIPAGTDREAIEAVVSVLAEEGVRLITISGDEMAEEDGSGRSVAIAHEKLIDAWPWLRQLVDENREMIALQNQIHDDAQAWEQEKDEGFLYRGGRLLQVEERLQTAKPNLDIVSQAFIQASLDQRQKEIEEKETQRQRELKQMRALQKQIQLAEARVLVANSWTLMSDRRITNQKLAQARLLAVEGMRLNQKVGRLKDQALSQELLHALAIEKPDTLQPMITLTGHDEVDDVSWKKDGSRLASASHGGTVIIWQADENQPDNWQPVTTLTDHTGMVFSVAWNGDGSRLASASNEVIIWQADENQPDSWQPVITLTDYANDVVRVAWSEDGSRLASASRDGTVIIWQADENQPDTWQPLATLAGHTDMVWSVAWKGDGSRLASASGDGTVIIWQADENQPDSWHPLTTLTNHMSCVMSVARSKDGSHLASASEYDGMVIIWNTKSWQPLTILTDHTSTVDSVAWNEDGSRLASASHDGTIIWDTSSWYPLATLINAYSIAWKGDGSRLASASKNAVIIWDTSTFPLSAMDHACAVRNVAWKGDGSRLASATTDGEVMIWQVNENQPDHWRLFSTLTDHTHGIYGIYSVAWKADGSRLASASGWEYEDTEYVRGEIIIWDTESWQPLATLTGYMDVVYSVAWKGDGNRLASTSEDSQIIIWQSDENQPDCWQPLARLIGHKYGYGIYSVTWREDGSRLASASGDGTVIVWQTREDQPDCWQPLATLTSHKSSVNSIAWKKDGSRLASASNDGTVIIWQTDENQPDCWQPMVTLVSHTDTVQSVAWNGNGDCLATASRDGTVIIWDTDSWQPLTTLPDHMSSVNSVAWKRDGSQLASASDDGTVIVWENPEQIWSNRNCELAKRNLSLAEWEQFLPGVAYRCTCGQWPAGEDAPADAPGCADKN